MLDKTVNQPDGNKRRFSDVAKVCCASLSIALLGITASVEASQIKPVGHTYVLGPEQDLWVRFGIFWALNPLPAVNLSNDPLSKVVDYASTSIQLLKHNGTAEFLDQAQARLYEYPKINGIIKRSTVTFKGNTIHEASVAANSDELLEPKKQADLIIDKSTGYWKNDGGVSGYGYLAKVKFTPKYKVIGHLETTPVEVACPSGGSKKAKQYTRHELYYSHTTRPTYQELMAAGKTEEQATNIIWMLDPDWLEYRAVHNYVGPGEVVTDTSTCNVPPSIPATGSITINEDASGIHTVVITDPDAGDKHTIQATAQPKNGTLTISGNKVTYKPSKDWNGTDSFKVQATDSAGAKSGVQTVTVTVKPVNDAPVIPATAAYAIDEDKVGAHTVAITDVDAGDTHTIEVTAQPANGKLSISGNKVTYTPNKDWNGTETFKVRAKDKAGAYSGIQTVTVTVKPVNDAPIIPATAAYAIDEDKVGTHTVAITDPDAGDTHTIEVTAQPANGKLAISGNKVTYTPNKNWNGTETFKVRAKDKAGAYSGIQTVTVTVKPVNDAPIIPATAAYAIDEDKVGTHTVVITDPDLGMPSDSHTLEVTQQPSNGTVTSAKSGNNFVLTYKPKKDWNGTDTVKVRVKDAAGAVSGVQTLTITVKPVNDAPTIPATAAYAIDEDTTGSHVVVISDVDFNMPGDSHTIEVTDNPKNGTVTTAKEGTNYRVTYKPKKDWNGTETFKVRVKDAAGAVSGIQTVTVTVKPVNDAPAIPAAATLTIDEDSTGTHTVVITDPDLGMPSDSHALEVTQQPANGTVSSAKSGNNYVLSYKPNKDWNGTDTLKVRVKDAAGVYSGVQTLTITVKPVNDAPVIPASAALTIDEDTTGTHTVVITDVDFGMPGDSHTLVVADGPKNGTLSNAKSGNNIVLTYKPNKDWNGTEVIKVQVKDQAGALSGVQTLTVTVNPVNDAPTIPAAATLVVNEDATGTHTVVITDPDLGMPSDSHTLEVTQQPANGTVSSAKSGNNYVLSYKPNKDWNGTDTLKVRVKDAAGVYSGVQTLTITVKPVNDAPVIPASAALTIDEDTTGTHTVVITDVDFGMPGDSHTLVVADGPKNGTLSNAKSGNNIVLTYKPNKDWNGTEVIKVQVKDQAGALSGVQTLTVTVNPVNDAPSIPATGSLTLEEDTDATHTVVITDVDFDMPHDSHTLEVVAAPVNGVVTSTRVGRDIVLTYTPNPDWNGTETFTVRVKDEAGAVSNIQTITATVTPVNDQPIIDPTQTLETDEDTELRFSVTVTDVDFGMPGDSHTVEVGGFYNSTVTVLSGGERNNPEHGLLFVPNKDWNGVERFWLRVIDEEGEGSLFQDVTVTVHPVNDAPTAVTVLGGTIEADQFNASTWHTIKVDDVDLPDHDEHSFEVFGDLQGGYVEFEDNRLRYVADGDFHGELTLTITATDEEGESVSSTFTVFVRELMMGETIRLPAVEGMFMGRNKRMPVVTPAYGKTLDEYEIKVLDSSSVGLMLDGEVIGVGAARTLNDGLFQNKKHVLELPVGSSQTGRAGEALMAIYPADMSEPARAYPIEFYVIETELAADTFEVVSLLKGLDVRVKHKDESTCRITLVEVQASSHDALTDPACLLEWVDLPDEASLATWRDESGYLLPALRGRAFAVGQQPVSYDLFMYDGSGNKVFIEHVSTQLNVLDASGLVTFKPFQEQPEVMRSVEQFKLLLVQDQGPVCQPTTDREYAIAQGKALKPYCYISWTEAPSTLVDPLIDTRPRLEGYLDELGTEQVKWQITAFSSNGDEVDLGQQSISVDVVAPNPPTIEVNSKFLFGDNYVVPLGVDTLGDATFLGEPADMLVAISRDGKEVESEVFYTGNVRERNRVNRLVETKHNKGLYGEQEIVLEAAYDLLPSTRVEKRLNVITAPAMEVEPLLELNDNMVLDNVAMPVSVKMVNRRSYDRVYRSEYGQWEVGIYQRINSRKDGESMHLISELQQTDADGQAFFDLDLTKVQGTSARLVAIARLVHSIPEYERTAESKMAFVAILYGGEVDGEVTSRKFSGESVYNARFQFVPNKEDMRVARAMGQTQWHVSTDGGQSWESEEPNTSRSLSRKFEKGIYHLKATSFNKHSGVEFVSAEVELIVYDKPTLELEGATRLMVGDSVDLKLTPFIHGEQRPLEDFVFEWSTDKGLSWEPGTNERTVTSEKVGTMQLRVRAREIDAPGSDRKAWTEMRINPRFYPVRGPKVGLRVPRKMEVGKEYTLTATARSRVAQMQGDIVGEFVLPDGSRVRGNEVTYTPTEADELAGRVPVIYEAWFEGFKDDGGFTGRSTNARIWEYVWPGFELKTVGTIRFAPTRINMGLVQSVPTHLEEPVYTWRLPEGVEVLRERGSRVEFIALKGGVFEVEVDVQDARGHESTVAMTLELEDAPAWIVENEVSYSNDDMRAPLTVSYRPSFSGGHPLDRVAKKRFYLNGELFKESGFTAKQELPAGTHVLSVEMESRYGQLVTDQIEVEVVPNQPPVCSVEVVDMDTKWRVVPDCEDPDGTVRRLNWNVNGALSSGSKYKTFIKSRIREETTIEVIAVDDSGDGSEPQRVTLYPEPGEEQGGDNSGPVEDAEVPEDQDD